ncbi:MAG: hypothetical protein DLM73_07445 [Chthoniobacterales bacterium]|nr:MAG: hypothetical protein DLM73_07445 [Chthoniobacterales bacterium]
MKPNYQISRQHGRLGEESSASRLHSNHPLTDCHFQAPASGAGPSHKLARPVFAPGFRDLSNEFLGAETTRSYVAEVLLFAVIVGVSAWPIVSMAQALAQLMK